MENMNKKFIFLDEDYKLCISSPIRLIDEFIVESVEGIKYRVACIVYPLDYEIFVRNYSNGYITAVPYKVREEPKGDTPDYPEDYTDYYDSMNKDNTLDDESEVY